MLNQRITLPGSGRPPIPNGNQITGTGGHPNPNEFIEVTISLRRKQDMPAAVAHAGSLTREQLAAQHGVTASDLVAVGSFAAGYQLNVVEENPAALSLKIAGSIANMERAFGVNLRNVRMGNAIYRERTGPITLPANVSQIIEGVFGLDNRPQASPRFRLAPHTALSCSPLDVARLYNFPPGDGEGQVIAIIELGGGYNPHDLNTYFATIGLTPPVVTAIPISGGTNAPTGDPNSADGEVMLDMEVAGAIAPKAAIKIYFAPNTDKGFLDAVNAAVHDAHTPTVVSVSWGGPEESWTAQSRNAFNKAFQNAAALSIPVTVASGDYGATDGTNALTVDFPASSPYALACGGTHLEGDKTITKEVVWNAGGGGAGGGVSNFFQKPHYQNLANVPTPLLKSGGRGVPDVCGNASVETGYQVRIDGTDTVIGGTSAVAPLWAGLVARLAQNLGHKVPFLNPVLYDNPQALHDITTGNNDVVDGTGKYKAGKGWDACTGLGSPDGSAILKALSGKTQKPLPAIPLPSVASPSSTCDTGTTGNTSDTGSTGDTGTTGTTGNMGTTGSNYPSSSWRPLPKAVAPHPIIPTGIPHSSPTGETEKITPPANNPTTSHACKCKGGDIPLLGCNEGNGYDQGIVALVAIVSNVATTAITAITAIAAGKK